MSIKSPYYSKNINRVIFLKTGIIRKIDELGRIVLPKELRNSFNINPGDDFEITVDNGKIILEKSIKLKNNIEEIEKIIKSIVTVNDYRIFLIIDNKLTINNEVINKEIIDKILERKNYINEAINKIKVCNSIYDEGRVIINPIVANSDLLCSILIISKDNIDNMIKIMKIIDNLIINTIVI